MWSENVGVIDIVLGLDFVCFIQHFVTVTLTLRGDLLLILESERH